jgi:hypothetical protein
MCSHSIDSQHFMEPKISLSHAQKLYTCPYPELDSPVHTTPSYLSKIHLDSSTHPRLGLSELIFPSGLPINNLYALVSFSIRATCLFHYIHLDLIILIILGEEYQSWSSLLCIFLHPPVTSPLFGPNILLSTYSTYVHILYACIHTYIQTQIYYMHAWTRILHTYISCIHILLAYIRIYIHAFIQTYIHTHIRTYI